MVGLARNTRTRCARVAPPSTSPSLCPSPRSTIPKLSIPIIRYKQRIRYHRIGNSWFLIFDRNILILSYILILLHLWIFKKFCPVYIICRLYRNGQNLWDMQYTLVLIILIFRIIYHKADTMIFTYIITHNMGILRLECSSRTFFASFKPGYNFVSWLGHTLKCNVLRVSRGRLYI